ncbi:hypothetical protein KHQ06_18365 [Nocardia tengchongensis]|uniref:Uncharacterized protein n=1 Tax=Nocardia tengchongensis TaxID=2055889 RepID=A0ABX8D1D0_9NOCA|nr:hypothetical protein [Nocardia tengchongensis]QVI24510.1 hypothetical protein KHQ06_18365 [Nocardia tengchongensis]
MSSVERSQPDSEGWYVAEGVVERLAAGRIEYHRPGESIADFEAGIDARIAAILNRSNQNKLSVERAIGDGGRLPRSTGMADPGPQRTGESPAEVSPYVCVDRRRSR